MASVRVKVLEGRNLKGWTDGKSDPFVIVSFDGHKEQTRKVRKTCDPVWNETLAIPVSNSDSLGPNRPITFTIFDKHLVRSDNPMGHVEIPIDKLVMGMENEQWYPVVDSSGDIKISLTAIGFGYSGNRSFSANKHEYKSDFLLTSATCDICESIHFKSNVCRECDQRVCVDCLQTTVNKVWYGCKSKESEEKHKSSNMSAAQNSRLMNFYLSYTSRDKTGKLQVHSLPKEWVDLFKAANVKPKELKDPDTVIFLLGLIDEHMEKAKGKGKKAEDIDEIEFTPEPAGERTILAVESQPGGPLSSSSTNIFPGASAQNRRDAPPPPSPADAQSRDKAPAPPTPSSSSSSSSSSSAPPPPPPPPPAPAVVTTKVKIVKSEKKDTKAQPAQTSDWLTQIKNPDLKKNLKKADDRELAELEDEERDDLVDAIGQAMVARRAAISKGGDDSDDDLDWDAWE